MAAAPRGSGLLGGAVLTARSSYIAARLAPLSVAHRALWVLAVGHSFALSLTVWMIGPKIVESLAFPISDPWLPPVLQSSMVYALAVLGPAAFGLYVVVRPSPGSLRLWAWWCFMGGAVGLVHQMTLGWAEVLLMFWTGAWGLWLAYAQRGVDHGPRYALLLIGLLFAYPAIGKYTPAFWSGEQYWALHWSHGSGVPGLLVSLLGEEVVRPWVRVYGPLSIVAETALALVWLLPWRVGFVAVVVGAGGILVGGGWGFLGAMGMVVSVALSGLAIAESGAFGRILGAER